MSLDFTFPLGRPGALLCRWCKTPRVLRKAALICPGCDRPTVSTTTTSSSIEETP